MPLKVNASGLTGTRLSDRTTQRDQTAGSVDIDGVRMRSHAAKLRAHPVHQHAIINRFATNRAAEA